MMLLNIKCFLSVSLILMLSGLANAESNFYIIVNEQNEASFSLNSELKLSEFVAFSNFPNYKNGNDSFFKRLFSKKTVAEQNSKSQTHATSKRSAFKNPKAKSNSNIPGGYTENGSPASTENQGVQNSPKEPLSTSRRDRVVNVPNKWELGLSIGSSHAVADIGDSKEMAFGDFVSYQFSNLGLNFGIYTKYKFTSYFAASFGMDYGSYIGVQSTVANNYSGYRFENDVFEFFGKTEFHAPFLKNTIADAYLFTGIGVFFNDLRVYDEFNRRHRVEVEYSQIQPTIPVGIGFGFKLNNKVRLGYELGYRYTFFNLFDGVQDVSTKYDKYFSNALKLSVGF